MGPFLSNAFNEIINNLIAWLTPLLSATQHSQLWAIALTLVLYLCGLYLYRRSGNNTLLQPVVSGIALLICVLLVTHITYKRYFSASELIHFLLSTATVTLAIPLYNHLHLLRKHRNIILASIFLGSAIASISAVFIAWLLGADKQLILSLAPKSITTPFAIGVSESIGGLPSLTASFVIITGIIVALATQPLCTYLKIESPLVIGTAMGLSGHGIATASAFNISPQAGAFSALAMGLTGTWTAITLPYVVQWLT